MPGELCIEMFFADWTFVSKVQSANCINYIKTKLFRLLVGIQKQTQHTTQKAFWFVPLQDFTNKSDIDLSKSISEIDKQLYKKYNLSQEEIDFIETKVKPMD